MTILNHCVNELMTKYVFKTMDDSGELYRYNAEKGIFENNAEPYVLQEADTIANSDSTPFLCNQILSSIKIKTPIKRTEFESDKNLVNLKNGMLNIQTLEFQPHNAKFLSIKQIPVNYDPNADCPNFKKFINDVVSPEDAETIIQFIGYCLVPHYNYQKALLLVGNGSNGKSKLLETIRALLGDNNVASQSLQGLCSNVFLPAELFDKMANIKSELSAKNIGEIDMFKQLTGGDMIQAQKKHKDPFQFYNKAKLIFSCNKVPLASSADDAYYRRWIVINFPNKFIAGENADENILEKLTTPEELSGLLNIAIKGYQDVVKCHCFKGHNDIAECKRKYLAYGNNSIASFILNKIVFSTDSFIEKDKLYSVYSNYCNDNQIMPESYDVYFKNLYQLLSNKITEFYPTINGERKYCIKGIGIKENNLKKEEN